MSIKPVYNRRPAITDKMPNRPISVFIHLCKMSKSSISSCTSVLCTLAVCLAFGCYPKRKYSWTSLYRHPLMADKSLVFSYSFFPLGSKVLSKRSLEKSNWGNLLHLDSRTYTTWYWHELKLFKRLYFLPGENPKE